MYTSVIVNTLILLFIIIIITKIQILEYKSNITGPKHIICMLKQFRVSPVVLIGDHQYTSKRKHEMKNKMKFINVNRKTVTWQ
jgi:hypothetical protein